MQFAFHDVASPFSSREIIYPRQKTMPKKQPDPYIASQRLCFRQIRAIVSEPRITCPENMTLWNGNRLGDYVSRVMILNYVD